jgi:hypothetical protein
MEPLFSIKAELAKRGRKIKDLAKAMNWDYGKLSRVLNGFQPATMSFDRQVNMVLKAWDVDNEREHRRV